MKRKFHKMVKEFQKYTPGICQLNISWGRTVDSRVVPPGQDVFRENVAQGAIRSKIGK